MLSGTQDRHRLQLSASQKRATRKLQKKRASHIASCSPGGLSLPEDPPLHHSTRACHRVAPRAVTRQNSAACCLGQACSGQCEFSWICCCPAGRKHGLLQRRRLNCGMGQPICRCAHHACAWPVGQFAAGMNHGRGIWLRCSKGNMASCAHQLDGAELISISMLCRIAVRKSHVAGCHILLVRRPWPYIVPQY